MLTLIKRVLDRYLYFLPYLGLLFGIFVFALPELQQTNGALEKFASRLALPLFVASITAIFVAIMVGRKFTLSTDKLIETQRHLDYILSSEISEIKSTISITSYGIEQIFRSEGEIIKRLPRLIESAHFRVDILRVNSLFWDAELQRSVTRALQRNVKFRVLLVDPESLLLDYYANHEKRDYLSFLLEIKKAEERWRELASGTGNVELRLYKGIISMSLILTDSTMVAAPYISGKLVRSVPQMQLTNGPIFRAYEEYLNDCWEQSPELSEH